MRASLPMYDLPELRAATDAWWAGLARALGRQGFAGAPAALDRGERHASVWRDPGLLLSQCCGQDLVTHLAGDVAPVAIPCYRAAGCGRGTYRSWLVGRRGDPRGRLGDFAGTVAAVNDTGSHSGWVALGHALVSAGLAGRFFARAVRTGSHRASLAAVARGEAELAAVDCVTFALVEQAEPCLVAELRIVAASEPAPALPYVTGAGQPDEARGRLGAALADAATDPSLAATRSSLLIDTFLPIAGDPYARIVAMAEAAAPALDGLAAALAPQG
jgi:ABC-type phosphate/phosphonate transport system substrate-binding protein